VYEFFSLIPPSAKEQRKKLKHQYQLQNKKFLDAEREKDKNKFGELGLIMKGLGERFEEIGDYYFASQAYLQWGRANDEPLRGTDADLKTAHDAYLKAVQAREKLELLDIHHAQTKERQQHLEAAGFGDPAKGPPKAAEPKEGAAITLAPTFELVEEIEEYRRPLFTADSLYLMWSTVQLRGKGTSTKFNGMKDSPTVLRVGSAEVMVDTDGDGEGDVEVPMTGKLVPVQVPIGSGDGQRQWGFLAAVGGTRDTYNGIQYNASASDEYMSIYVAPAGSVVADLAGTQVRIFDDNMDGIYGSAPMSWAHTGLVPHWEENYQYDFDSVVVGAEKAAQPWSEFLRIGAAWYRMESADTGLAIKATPMLDLTTGKLKLDLKGLSADWVVVRGAERSKYENCFFEIAGNRGGVEVPVGMYSLVAGQVSKGSKAQMAKALIVPGRNAPSWTVAPGETTEVELGAPFGFAFDTTEDAESLTVVGDSVAITGSGGESYQRLWNCVVRPEVSIREAGSKRGSKPEDMSGAGTQEELAEKGFQYAWFPYDLVLEKKSAEDHEAMLLEKKNKLFGKIESEWR
jgi:hypothetical protein